MGVQGKLFTGLRTVLRVFCPLCKTPPLDEFTQPAVYVCHHQNMRGPIASLLWLPIPVRPWSLHIFFDKEDSKRHFGEYTFHTRHGWPMWLSKLVAAIISTPVSAMLHSAGAIPVYRKTMESMKTIRKSVEALEQGESVIIYPDIDYKSDEAELGEIYDGFLLIERYYYMRTGKHVAFVPLFVSAREKKMLLNEPIYFDETDFLEQRPKVRQEIRDSINHLVANH